MINDVNDKNICATVFASPKGGVSRRRRDGGFFRDTLYIYIQNSRSKNVAFTKKKYFFRHLPFDETGQNAALRHRFIEGAALFDAPTAKQGNAVGVAYRGQTRRRLSRALRRLQTPLIAEVGLLTYANNR